MNAATYSNLLADLNHAREIRLSPLGMIDAIAPAATAAPHTADDDFFTPRSFDTAQHWLARLPHRQIMVCALTAAEMFVEWWAAHDISLGEFDGEEISAARGWHWIAAMYRQVAGTDADLAAAEMAAVRRWMFAPKVEFNGGFDEPGQWNCSRPYRYFHGMAMAVERAASDPENAATHIAEALAHIVAGMAKSIDPITGKVSVRDEKPLRIGLLAEWWSRCRRRLALADVCRASIEWGSVTNPPAGRHADLQGIAG